MITKYFFLFYRSDLQWLCEVFSICWSVCEPCGEVHNFACSNTNMLFLWAVWEAAQLCISCKLRTPLGKPLDTFMAFEGWYLFFY